MEALLEHIKLYTINEVTLSSDLIKFKKNKKYVIVWYENNNMIKLFINYKFDKMHYSHSCNMTYYCFKHNTDCSIIGVNNNINQKNILELVDDFNNGYFMDLLLTHYSKNIEYHNINNRNIIHINLENNEVYNYIKYYSMNLLCLSLINIKLLEIKIEEF